MLECLIALLIVVIVVLIVLWILESVLTALGVTPPPPIMVLVRILAALIVLIYALQCLGLLRELPIGPRHAIAVERPAREPAVPQVEASTSTSTSIPLSRVYCIPDGVRAWSAAHPGQTMTSDEWTAVIKGCQSW